MHMHTTPYDTMTNNYIELHDVHDEGRESWQHLEDDPVLVVVVQEQTLGHVLGAARTPYMSVKVSCTCAWTQTVW